MTTTFLNTSTQNIGVTPTAVLSTTTSGVYTVIGLNLANTTNTMIQVSVQLFTYTANGDGTNNTSSVTSQAYIAKNIMMAPQSSLKLITNSEKLILSANQAVVVTANNNNSVDAIVSYVSIV
jgi:hypothetical protein